VRRKQPVWSCIWNGNFYAQNNLDLTLRGEEIFTMLLTGRAPKEIAHTLKISYYTVLFHQKNFYRRLGIQSRAELFVQYNTIPMEWKRK